MSKMIHVKGPNNSSITAELGGSKWAKFKDVKENVYMLNSRGKIYNYDLFRQTEIKAEIKKESVEYVFAEAGKCGLPFEKKTIYRIQRKDVHDKTGLIYCSRRENDKDEKAVIHPLLTESDIKAGKNAVLIEYKPDIKYVFFPSSDKGYLICRSLNNPAKDVRYGNPCTIAEIAGTDTKNTYGVAVKFDPKTNKIIQDSINSRPNSVPVVPSSITRYHPETRNDKSYIIPQNAKPIEFLSSDEIIATTISYLSQKLDENKITLRNREKEKLQKLIKCSIETCSALPSQNVIKSNIDEFFSENKNLFIKKSINYTQDFFGSLTEFFTRLFNGERIWGIDEKGVDHRKYVVNDEKTFTEKLVKSQHIDKQQQHTRTY